MNYYILRGDQQYGPYSLADLQRYVASGNIVMTDLTRSDGMSDWVPVSQVIGNVAVPQTPAAPTAFAQPGVQPATAATAGTVYPGYGVAAAPAATGPVPPNLHWALVLVLSLATCGLFALVWAFVQGIWVRKIKRDCNAVFYFTGQVVLAFSAGALAVFPTTRAISGLIGFIAMILFFIGAFQIKGALEDYYNSVEDIRLELSKTLFMVYVPLLFGIRAFTLVTALRMKPGPGLAIVSALIEALLFYIPVYYFQYHLSRINKWKTTGVLTPQG